MLRRSATMAGNSISGSFPHSFHQGRGRGGTGGWKFQTASARKIRCSKNWLRSALDGLPQNASDFAWQ